MFNDFKLLYTVSNDWVHVYIVQNGKLVLSSVYTCMCVLAYLASANTFKWLEHWKDEVTEKEEDVSRCRHVGQSAIQQADLL